MVISPNLPAKDSLRRINEEIEAAKQAGEKEKVKELMKKKKDLKKCYDILPDIRTY
ncbi:MAG: hypothetical protein M0R46_01040 [Candidatus Muirbacterium halophilum]|nr:hypothetical protein [Candidatus Muirbacterium halophilum]MCK9474480.1 hypothetical protein [Candidatus Muirbacterium halophilum]